MGYYSNKKNKFPKLFVKTQVLIRQQRSWEQTVFLIHSIVA